MNIYKLIKEFKDAYVCEYREKNRSIENVHFTDSSGVFEYFSSILKLSEKKPFGYHAIDLRGAERIKISVNRIEVFKQLTRLSMCEEIAKHIYHNSEEIRKENEAKSDLKTELEVFCSNYHPFDFYKFYEKRTENKISFSCLRNGVVERETFNVGNLTLFLIDDIDAFIEIADKNGSNKRVDRKFDERTSNCFEYKSKKIIFEFSGKSHYKSLFELLEYN